jgi:hypothetical protein
MQLKIDSELKTKTAGDPGKPKIEKNEVRGISNFFKPKERTIIENSPSKCKDEIHNLLLKGLQVYHTEAKR